MRRQDELLSKATDSRSRFGFLRALCASTSLAGFFADGGTVLQDVETNTGGWYCTVTQHHFLRHCHSFHSQDCAPCVRTSTM